MKREDPYGRGYFQTFLRREGGDTQRNRNRLRALLEFRHDGRLLEMGCGTGGFLRAARAYFRVEGMDASAYAVQEAQRSLGESIRQGDIAQEELEPGAYAVIAAYNVLEHLPDPGAVLSRIAGALEEGGVLAGSVPNNFGLVGGLHTALTNRFDPTHVSTFPPKVWLAAFERAGLRPVRLFGELLLGHNRSLHIMQRGWPYLSFNFMFICERG